MKGIKNLNQILTLEGVAKKNGRHPKREDLSIIEDGAIVFNKDEILWIGKTESIPLEYQEVSFLDGSNRILTPEIVDSHTHLVFGGDRSWEYGMRLDGADYQDIAKAGGGILSTMRMTNELSEDELYELAIERVQKIHSYGVGTIEVKTGYGLTIESELRCARVIKRLKEKFNPKIKIFSTFMPAHAVPKQYKSVKEYMDQVVYPATEKALAEGLLDAVDIFHEVGYFDNAITEEFLNWATEKGLPIKMHVDEFNDNGGASLAAKFKALSCDHLLCVGDKGLEDLKESETVATILPGTGFFLGKPQAPARKLIDSGARLAIASDYNPGSCHCDNLLLISSLAAPHMNLSLAELWSGITYNAAGALGLDNQGSLLVGKSPRFSVFQAKILDEITYNWGVNKADPDLITQVYS